MVFSFPSPLVDPDVGEEEDPEVGEECRVREEREKNFRLTTKLAKLFQIPQR